MSNLTSLDKKQVLDHLESHLIRELSCMVLSYLPTVDLFRVHVPVNLKSVECTRETIQFCYINSSLQNDYTRMDLSSGSMLYPIRHVPHLVEIENMSTYPFYASCVCATESIPMRFLEHKSSQAFLLLSEKFGDPQPHSLSMVLKTGERDVKILFSQAIHESFVWSQDVQMDWSPELQMGHLLLHTEDPLCVNLYRVSVNQGWHSLIQPIDLSAGAKDLRLTVSTSQQVAMVVVGHDVSENGQHRNAEVYRILWS